MATSVSNAARRTPLWVFLGQELAPREGRGIAVARIAAATTLTVVIAMVFRIPLAAYMAYLVFLTSKEDQKSTTTTAIGGALAVTLAVLFTLGLSLIDLGEPAIRLPAMALVTFLAMFSVRTFALGPVSFLSGFIVVTMQSVIDEVPNTEVFTRTALWLWVVVVVPVIITELMNQLTGPSSTLVAWRGFRKVLEDLAVALRDGGVVRHLPQWRERLQPLIPKANGASGAQAVSPAAISRLQEVLVILEQYPDPVPMAERELLAGWVGQCLAALEHPVQADTPAALIPAVISAVSAARAALADAFQGLLSEISSAPTPAGAHQGHKAAGLFVPDALRNPAHWQFALKTTVAVMIVYAVYSLLDWPGLRTSIVTCFFVSLGSLGETVHKLTLRLSGALIGGLLAGLCIVFVLPYFTDIGQLSILTAVFSLFAGWVATSSERLSYAGLQIAFAFFLGVLQTDAPATDLTVLRDRAVGIILGNITVTVVFSTLWPESALSRLRTALADAQRALAALLREPGERAAARQRTVEALARADHFDSLSQFELQMLPRRALPGAHLPELHRLERLAAAAFVVTSAPVAPGVKEQALAPAAMWLDAAGDATAEQQAAPAPPSPVLQQVRAAPEIAGPLSALWAQAATAQLHLEIERAAATAQ